MTLLLPVFPFFTDFHPNEEQRHDRQLDCLTYTSNHQQDENHDLMKILPPNIN